MQVACGLQLVIGLLQTKQHQANTGTCQHDKMNGPDLPRHYQGEVNSATPFLGLDRTYKWVAIIKTCKDKDLHKDNKHFSRSITGFNIYHIKLNSSSVLYKRQVLVSITFYSVL